MKIIIAIAIFLILVFYITKQINGTAKFAASMNALLAKHTLTTLSPLDREKVMSQAANIFQRLTGGPWEKLEAPHLVGWKYGLIALAMGELGIQPAAAKNNRWHTVKYPFQLNATDPQIKLAHDRLLRTDNINVTLRDP